MKRLSKLAAMTALVFFVTAIVFEPVSYARAGGGRSFGGKSYSSSPSRSNSFSQPRNNGSQTQNKGSLLKSIGGGIIGGMLGSMLFRSLGFGGGGAMGGILQLLIFAGIGYLIFRFIRSRIGAGRAAPRAESQSVNTGGFFKGNTATAGAASSGLSDIISSDPSFNEKNFKDNVMDMFFKIQAAWMNRDLSSASHLLDDKMRDYLQSDINDLKSSGKINKLENIAVRNIDIDEAWQESDSDCITVLLYANLLDYTVNETTGNILEGSNTDPVKFEEYWTFYRKNGTGQWKLSAINQK